MTAPPAPRTLPMVLRRLLEPRPAVQLLIGTMVSADGNAYVNVTLGGDNIRVPRLAGTSANPGAVAYCLATGDFILYIGTVST